MVIILSIKIKYGRGDRIQEMVSLSEGYNKLNIPKKQTSIMGIKKECPFFNGHSEG